MGVKALVVILPLWALSFFALTTLPDWISNNWELSIMTYIMLNIGFALAFVEFGLRR